MKLPIPKILQAMRQNGSLKPESDFDDDHTYFLCRLPVHPQATMPEGLAKPLTPQVTPQVRRLLVTVTGEMSRQQIQTALRLDDRESLRKLYLAPAIASEYIERTIPDKPNSRLQKYPLTPKGRTLLALLSTSHSLHPCPHND